MILSIFRYLELFRHGSQVSQKEGQTDRHSLSKSCTSLCCMAKKVASS